MNNLTDNLVQRMDYLKRENRSLQRIGEAPDTQPEGGMADEILE